MRLSEAIIVGRSLRPETRRERFANMANGGLCSDVWGAACEAVEPRVAKQNWSSSDPVKREAAQEYLRAVQQKVFGHYFRMPARCPGATQLVQKSRGRYTGGYEPSGLLKMKVEDGAKTFDAGGITSECDKVETLAGAVDHLFHAHNWTTEEVVHIVEWYEETRTDAALALAFTHFPTPVLQSRINRRLLAKAKAKIEKRNERRRSFVVN